MAGADPFDETFGDLDPMGSSAAFVLRPPFEDAEVIEIESQIRSAVEVGQQVLREEGVEAFKERYLAKERHADKSPEECEPDDQDTATKNAIIDGQPRLYQLAFFEKCKNANTIVHLGTGQGKTLIALLCIQHFMDNPGEAQVVATPAGCNGKQSRLTLPLGGQPIQQSWFLVPSVALAVQHTVTIRANLPSFRVATACNTTSGSEKARDALSRAHIVIATHGSALDLLRHYGDCFFLERVNVLIFDECHYATGSHGYAQLLDTFYHRMQPSERPRIVGLTASPIINVKNVSPFNLEKSLSELEAKLDSTIVCFSDIGEPSKECLEVIKRDVVEQLITFDNGQTSFSPLPGHKDIGLHVTRERELNQLENLYEELGPCVTGEYCSDLARELSISRYEGENANQFERMVSHLKELSVFCSRQCAGKEKGQTKKLVMLENLLHRMLISGLEPDGVGLVFVERRITALALHGYLRRRQSERHDSAKNTIRCDCLVRQSHQVFKYLHRIHAREQKTSGEYEEVIKEAEQDWLHQTKKIRTVLDELRRREINLLIATSVVEEGVDVRACSFVVVLDGIRTTKSYVQMKGRARQKMAKFFCFRDTSNKELTVPLREAQLIDEEVRKFLELREENVAASESVMSAVSSHLQTPSVSVSEADAMRTGEYTTEHARVDCKSAKSLLNHYFLSVPIDSSVRASKEAMKRQLPSFEDMSLVLPAHLPPEIRKCELPVEYSFLRKKTREELLALIAVVRLHEHKLLNDRLLPLQRNDLHKILSNKILRVFPASTAFARNRGSSDHHTSTMYLYALSQGGAVFDQHRSALDNRRRELGLLSRLKLPEEVYSGTSFGFDHPELGLVHCRVGVGKEVEIDSNQWNDCTDFYSVLINARWSRRTGRHYFCFDESSCCTDIVAMFAVISITDDGRIDFARMEKTLADSKRSEELRVAAIRDAVMTPEREPRLWAPLYSPNTTYISFLPSTYTCSSPFPDPDKGASYRDYFLEKYSCAVDGRLFCGHRLWTEPRKMTPVTRGSDVSREIQEKAKKQKIEWKGVTREQSVPAGTSFCSGLTPLLLPEEACMEAPLADASLYLHCILLPQILYELNRCLVSSAFVRHCCGRFDRLGEYLKKLQVASVTEVLTAKSCSIDGCSYDRLEYLGDAVLKLLHTDLLIHSKVLKQWTRCLHEGDLTKLRSEMGCNERLSKAARSAGIDRFILTVPLARGLWAPNGFVRKKREKDTKAPSDKVVESDFIEPSMKVRADVMEALLGIIYTEFGYGAAAEVVDELLISLPFSVDNSKVSSSVTLDSDCRNKVNQFVDHKFEKIALVKEALTHASYIFTDVPSYQKLEWVGDAVLCLAAREWAFASFPSLPVADLVTIETTIICNETLSCISVRNGLHGLIYYADHSLPGRIENFALNLRGEEWGLWGSNPPKVLADVVEALIGAAHIDGGFRVGQQSALFVVRPVLVSLGSSIQVDESRNRLVVTDGAMMHPKQVLSEMGSFLKVRVIPEADAAKESSVMVWRQKSWSQVSTRGNDVVCRVTCLGINIGAVAESSTVVARNRGCAIIAEVLRRNPKLLELMRDLAAKLSANN